MYQELIIWKTQGVEVIYKELHKKLKWDSFWNEFYFFLKTMMLKKDFSKLSQNLAQISIECCIIV